MFFLIHSYVFLLRYCYLHFVKKCSSIETPLETWCSKDEIFMIGFVDGLSWFVITNVVRQWIPCILIITIKFYLHVVFPLYTVSYQLFYKNIQFFSASIIGKISVTKEFYSLHFIKFLSILTTVFFFLTRLKYYVIKNTWLLFNDDH